MLLGVVGRLPTLLGGADGWRGVGVVGVVPPTPTPPHEGEGGPVVGVRTLVRCSAPYDGGGGR